MHSPSPPPEWLDLILSVHPVKSERRWKSRELEEEQLEPPVVVRLDGVGFGRRAPRTCGKPRCPDLHFAQVEAAERLCDEMGCTAAYVVSDEVSLVFARELPYSGRAFKVLSISSSQLSSRVSLKLSTVLPYDARFVRIEGPSDALEYILWRARVALNNYVAQVYHEVTGLGLTPKLRVMLSELSGTPHDPLKEPPWRLVGTLTAKVEEVRDAVDARTGCRIKVRRRVWRRSSDPREWEWMLREAWRL